jgi:hypothetical protein
MRAAAVAIKTKKRRYSLQAVEFCRILLCEATVRPDRPALIPVPQPRSIRLLLGDMMSSADVN